MDIYDKITSEGVPSPFSIHANENIDDINDNINETNNEDSATKEVNAAETSENGVDLPKLSEDTVEKPMEVSVEPTIDYIQNISEKDESNHENDVANEDNCENGEIKENEAEEEPKDNTQSNRFLNKDDLYDAVSTTSTINSNNEDFSEDFCVICRNGGDLLYCNYCPRSYHLQCHVPSIHSKPE